jgi:hypothetical protein
LIPMEESWMHIAEFGAYVVAVVVGLDMIAERWLPCCKTRKVDELQEVLIVDNPEPSNDDDDGTVNANDDFNDLWQGI